MKTTYLILLSVLVLPVVQAEVITDGSLGAKVELPGNDFHITPELGQQLGGNLFHSFQNFNLSAGESATFSSANTVQNVIARVTGGQPSTIDGTLRSTIPNADLYFLNPYGILFGKNAKLDLQGGFHASTADYLKLQDGGRFDARQLNNTLLTVAPVEAFGFLTKIPTTISIQDSHLSVPEGKTLSLIGGDLHLAATKPYTIGTQLNFDAELLAPGGRINLASIASQGEVIPTNMDLSLNQVARLGKILVQNTAIATQRPGGNIFIRGGQFELAGGAISSQTNSNQNGGLTDIQVDNLKVTQGGQISSSTFGTGKAGTVVVKANTVEISGAHQSGEEVSAITSHSDKENGGDAGAVEITARQLSLMDGAIIISGTEGIGQGGSITLKVTDNLSLTNGHIFSSSNSVMYLVETKLV